VFVSVVCKFHDHQTSISFTFLMLKIIVFFVSFHFSLSRSSLSLTCSFYLVGNLVASLVLFFSGCLFQKTIFFQMFSMCILFSLKNTFVFVLISNALFVLLVILQTFVIAKHLMLVPSLSCSFFFFPIDKICSIIDNLGKKLFQSCKATC